MTIISEKIDKVVYVKSYPIRYCGTQYYIYIWGYKLPVYFKEDPPIKNDWDNTPKFDGSINR